MRSKFLACLAGAAATCLPASFFYAAIATSGAPLSDTLAYIGITVLFHMLIAFGVCAATLECVGWRCE